jgi:hypothetical protein
LRTSALPAEWRRFRRLFRLLPCSLTLRARIARPKSASAALFVFRLLLLQASPFGLELQDQTSASAALVCVVTGGKDAAERARNVAAASRKVLAGPRKALAGPGKIPAEPGKMSAAPGKVAAEPGEMPAGSGKIPAKPGKVVAGPGKMSAEPGKRAAGG